MDVRYSICILSKQPPGGDSSESHNIWSFPFPDEFTVLVVDFRPFCLLLKLWVPSVLKRRINLVMLRCVIDLLLTTRIHQFFSHIRALQITSSLRLILHTGAFVLSTFACFVVCKYDFCVVFPLIFHLTAAFVLTEHLTRVSFQC